MKAERRAKNGDLMHSDDCAMVFGRKDSECPRCVELMRGASPRARFGGRETRAQADERRVREIRAHVCSSSCGVICTYGEW